MTIEEMFLELQKKYIQIFDYENWCNMERREGKLSIIDFNNLSPFDKIKMYDDWIKSGRWEYGNDPMGN